MAISQNKSLPNPASAYARFLGYRSEIRTDSAGNQRKVCILPDGRECDEWLFFRGSCGKEFSYCAIKGCSTENYTDSAARTGYAVCTCTDSLGQPVRIPMLDLMWQNGDDIFSESKRKEVKK